MLQRKSLMRSPCRPTAGIMQKVRRGEMQLIPKPIQESSRQYHPIAPSLARVTEQRDMDGQPEPVFSAAARSDQIQIGRRQQVMAHHAIRVCRDIEEVGAGTSGKQ